MENGYRCITCCRDCDSGKIYSRYRCSKENTSDPGAGAVATAIYIYIQVKKKAFKINAKIEDVGLNED